MTLKEFLSSLRKSYELYENLGVAYGCPSLHSLASNTEFNKFALDTNIAYPEVFFQGIKLQQFNFQLKDYSYFQFSYTSADDVRYAFYPSPYDSTQLEEINAINESYLAGRIDSEAQNAFIEGVSQNYSRPLIRYEYNSEQYDMGIHPASHFHLGTYGDDRWVIERRLTPFAFALLIGKLYFKDHWECLTNLDQNGIRISNEFDTKLHEEKKLCRITPADQFSIHEENIFYFK